MIMAEKIALLRKQNGWSQEELAEKLNVSRQAVSRWESGGSIPDLERVVKLSALFGVSMDYLVKDGAEKDADADDGALQSNGTAPLRASLDEANTYLTEARRAGRGIALGVGLCIFAPASLLLLLGLWCWERMEHGAAIGFGIAALLIFLAAGITLLILNGMRLNKFRALEREPLELEYGVFGIVQKRKEDFAPRFRLGIALGVAAIILGVIPLVIAGAIEAPEGTDLLWTAFLLICIACGIYAIILVSTVQGSYQRLLEEGDYTPENKRLNQKIGALPGIYWSLSVAVYLVLSFLTERWDATWVVWPVAGVLFPAVLAIARAIARGSLEE